MTDPTDGSGAANGILRGLTEPAHLGDERTAILGFLQRQRDLVAWKLKDADDDALRAVRTGTGLTIHGLVRHLTDVERSWIRDDFAGEPDLEFGWDDDDPDGPFAVPDDVGVEDLLRSYRDEAARCDVVIASATLDTVSAKDGFSLRWILLHLIEETARHLGHLDLLRELADGTVGEEPKD